MPRLTLVSMSGLRVVDPELLALGMRLPGLRRRASALAQLPPLGLLSIAAVVDSDWTSELIIDQSTEATADTLQRILKTQPDVVAFSSLSASADRASQISERLRQRQITTVIGGLHATGAPEWAAERFDIVATGDGEVTLPMVLSDWGNHSLRRIYSPNAPADISLAPPPRWDLWSQDVTPRYTVQTMRGCPWACQFCAASRLLGPARVKSRTRIQQELKQIASTQRRPWIELADDNTFAGERDPVDFLDDLKAIGARWFTESDWLIGKRPELLRRIASSGCRQILIGLESPIHTFAGMGGKTASWDSMIDAIENIQDAGIVVNACFIVGVDGETEKSIAALGDYLETAPFGEIQVTLQTPFPGTRLYDSMRHQDRLLYDDFSRHTLFDVTYQPDAMSADQLRRAFRQLIGRVFSIAQQQRRNLISRTIRRNRRALS